MASEIAARDAAGSGAAQWFRTQDIVGALGISRRQLQYWAKTGLVVPSARTPGGHHRYAFADLVALKAAKRLIDAGVSVQRIRRSVEALAQRLPSVERPLEELVIVATGDVLVVFDRGTVFEALSGQEWVFDVAQFQREVEGWSQQHSKSVRPVRRARTARRGAVQQRAVG
jgi:DNA-binding transcriptional MerR regulator